MSTLVALSIPLTACGDQVTAARDWYSVAEHTTSVTTVAGQAQDVSVFDGPLDVARGGVATAGTRFHEQCTRPHTPAAVWTCVALVNAGQRVYIAAGTAGSELNHTLRVLAGPHGSLTIKTLGAGTKSVSVEISARP